MKKSIVLSFLAWSGIGLFAQEIDISKFVLPEYKRSELEFNLSSSNSGSYLSNNSENDIYYTKGPALSTNSLADVTLRKYSNNARYQGFLQSNFNFSLPVLSKTWYKSENSETNNFDRQSSLNLDVASSNRFYKDSKLYYEVNPAVYLRTNSSQDLDEFRFDIPTNNYHTSYERLDFSTGLSSGFRIGIGRVEPVEDMRQVVYILDDLKKAGRLKRELTQDETLVLSKKLSLLKNRRFLDARLRLIEETAEIEKIMTEMDLITENDALFFATVNDYWSITANPSRSSGNRLSLGASPGIGFIKYNTLSSNKYFDPDTVITSEIRQQEKYYGVGLSARYEQFKPINLYWQQDFYIDISANLKKSNNELLDESNSSQKDQLITTFNVNYSLKYYPDSRTTYYGTASIRYRLFRLNEEFTSIENEDNEDHFSTVINVNADHYFSPQLTLHGSFGMNFYNNDNTWVLNTFSGYTKGNDVTFNLSLGLSYKLF